MLGLTVDAVRKRVKRGTLESERGADGRVYVFLDVDPDAGAPRSDTDRLISALEEQLRLEREAHAEARRLLAAALERIPAIEPPGEPESVSEPVPETPAPAEPETPRMVDSSVPHSRQGMSARVLVLGAIFTVLATAFLASYVRHFLYEIETPYGLPFGLLVFGPFCVVLLFGLSAGYTKRPALPWFSWPHRWLRRSGRSVLKIALFVGGIPATIGFLTGLFYAAGGGVIGGVKGFSAYVSLAPRAFFPAIGILVGIASLSFMSGAFLGNALRRVGLLGTPKELPQGEEEGEHEEEVWSPRKEARWGLVGSIIVALISAVASVLAASINQ